MDWMNQVETFSDIQSRVLCKMNTSTHFEVDDKGDFELSKAKVLQDLLRCSSFVDVTLVNDDADQFGVHKLVLSTVSPVLRKIFEKNPQDHPLLFMRGVNSRQLEALVKFIYTGEASVNVNELNDFISLGTDLKITEVQIPDRIQ